MEDVLDIEFHKTQDDRFANKVNLVRYADDFVVTASSREVAERAKEVIINEHTVYSMAKLEAKEPEAEEPVLTEETGANVPVPKPETEPAKPTIRELYDQYKPVILSAISEDTAYRNACGHSDQENATIEGNAAIRRAILDSHDMELIRLYSDVPTFRDRLHQEAIAETYPKLHDLLRPLSQDDIDSALRAWNGDIASKRAVVRYMKDHARDKDTAA